MVGYQAKNAVLLMTYKRPETTARVLDSLAEVKPWRVYIGSDGAKNTEEEEKVSQVRLLAKRLPWSCEVNTLFSDRNQGCRESGKTTIDWYFFFQKATPPRNIIRL